MLSSASRVRFNRALRKLGVYSFLSNLPHGASVLDVGCGLQTPRMVADNFPHLRYHGIDIVDPAIVPFDDKSRYIQSSPEQFARDLRQAGRFDAIVSAHNLEHCDQPNEVLEAIASALNPGGRLYMSFPSQSSVGFPRRAGSLNYFDDATHKNRPPDPGGVSGTLGALGMELDVRVDRHRPAMLFLLGLAIEPLSRLTGKVYRGTWELYGFEAILWMTKRDPGARVTPS